MASALARGTTEPKRPPPDADAAARRRGPAGDGCLLDQPPGFGVAKPFIVVGAEELM
jgi:hypothetical protein